MRHRGFSIVEIVLAALFLALLIGAATSAIARDHVAHRTIIGQYGPEMRAQHTLERIAAELRMAGEWAEDRDHDGALDDGEDTNENGDLDADWNLVMARPTRTASLSTAAST